MRSLKNEVISITFKFGQEDYKALLLNTYVKITWTKIPVFSDLISPIVSLYVNHFNQNLISFFTDLISLIVSLYVKKKNTFS